MERNTAIALIGFGAIGRKVVELARKAPGGSPIRVVLVRPDRVSAVRGALPTEIAVVGTLDALFALKPGLVAECAGHGAVRQYGAAVLARGIDFLVASTGALADAATEAALREAAGDGGAQVLVPAGAIGGADLIGAARLGGLERVTYTSRKKPVAWKGTPAEKLLDLDRLTAATPFFRGPAREAALAYPQNANVAATVGLAGLGLDRTTVVLTADPDAPGNEHGIDVEGAFGKASFRIAGRTLPDNPKTSMLAALSVAHAILQRGQRFVI